MQANCTWNTSWTDFSEEKARLSLSTPRAGEVLAGSQPEAGQGRVPLRS